MTYSELLSQHLRYIEEQKALGRKGVEFEIEGIDSGSHKSMALTFKSKGYRMIEKFECYTNWQTEEFKTTSYFRLWWNKEDDQYATNRKEFE